MNKNQWFVLGGGLFFLGWALGTFAMDCSVIISDSLLTACFINRYAFVIPGIISTALGILFVVCGFFEKK